MNPCSPARRVSASPPRRTASVSEPDSRTHFPAAHRIRSGAPFVGQKFDAWVQKVRASSDRLDMSVYRTVAESSEKAPVRYFSSVDPRLFHNIIAKYNDGTSST
jgi:hypothetical protein